MVISEMDYNPYRFFLTQKFKGRYEMFSSEFAIFVGYFCLSPGALGMLFWNGFFGREILQGTFSFIHICPGKSKEHQTLLLMVGNPESMEEP